MRRHLLEAIIGCPLCHADLIWQAEELDCPSCGVSYPVLDGKPDFAHNADKSGDADFQDDLMRNRSLTARMFNLGQKVINSEYTPRDHLKEFLASTRPGDVVVELGSGNRRLRDDIINIDLFRFPNADIASDISYTPLKDESVDCAILDSVLEHVPEPRQVIGEVQRILKPGGRVIVVTPFVFPYHGYPRHYANFSPDGLQYLLRDFSDCQVEMNIGPTSAIINMMSEYWAVALGGNSRFAYTAVKGASLLPIFLFKYVDRFWKGSARGARIASHLCAVATK